MLSGLTGFCTAVLLGTGFPLAEGLARYYPFDEPVTVASTGDLYFVGADNYTTLGTAVSQPAKFGGGALVSTGAKGAQGGYLRSVDNARDWQPGTGDFTCSVWVRAASPGACDILSRGGRNEPRDPLGRTGWALARTAEGAVVLSVGTTAGTDAALRTLSSVSRPFAESARYVHLAWTRANDVITLYVDGKVEGRMTGWRGCNIAITSKVWYRELRTNPATGNGNMRAGDGLDDLAFWTRALSGADVARLAQGERPLGAFLPPACRTGYAPGTDKSPIDYTHDAAFMQRYRTAAIAIAERKREGRKLMPTGGGFSGFFVWDTVFGVLWGVHAPEMNFPLTDSLDNFYRLQDADGFICREYSREGDPCWDKRHPWAYNPPILAWGEVALFRAKVSDTNRLARVYPHLVKFHTCYQKNLRRPDGLYFSDILGCGMDDLPRWPYGFAGDDLVKGGIPATRDMVGEKFRARFWDRGWLRGIAQKHAWNRQAGWIDMSAQMAFDCLNLAEIATALGRDGEAKRWRAEQAEIAAVVNAKCWDASRGFYFDRTDDGIIPRYTAAAFWTLLARIPSEEQVERLVKVFDDPKLFGTCVPVTTQAVASDDYRANGYWPGQVWPPTTYMTIEGLRAYGRHALAARLARAWYNGNARLFELHGTVYENISPHFGQRGTGSPDFCGWGALAPVALPSEFGWLVPAR